MRVRKGFWTIFLATFYLVVFLTASPAVAATVTFTSTADFDAGTKSNPGDGNYGVETNTDNLGIAVGGFELSSLKGDSFTLADTDADTFKWDAPATCTLGTPTTTIRDISGGVLNLGTADALEVSRVGLAASSTFADGVFDIRLKLDEVAAGVSTTVWFQMLNEQRCDWFNSGTQDGVIYQWDEGSVVDGNFGVSAFRITNGGATIVGTETTLSTDPIFLRIARTAGDTLTWYYSTDGSAWTQDETVGFTFTGATYVSFLTTQATVSATADDFDLDDFYSSTGTLSAGGFRTTGTWTSATQTYANNEVVDNVVVTYSGATASVFIDSFSLLDSAGGSLFTDGTDRTSGTSTTYTIPFSDTLRQDWAVRLVLAGGNAGTVTLESLAVETVIPPAPGGDGGGSRRVSVSCSLDWVTQTIGCADLSSYTGANIDRINWYVDGRFVQSTGKNAAVTLGTGDSFFNAQNRVRHEVIMEVIIVNGGRQPNTFEVTADYSARLILFLGIAALVIVAVVLIVRRATTRSISFPRVKNPSYRRTAISTEEYPRGWVSYRQRDPDKYESFRSKVIRRDSRKRPTVIAVFGLRPATAAERERTGRTRVAEIQTVRERIPKTRRA